MMQATLTDLEIKNKLVSNSHDIVAFLTLNSKTLLLSFLSLDSIIVPSFDIQHDSNMLNEIANAAFALFEAGIVIVDDTANNVDTIKLQLTPLGLLIQFQLMSDSSVVSNFKLTNWNFVRN